jgi:hypothetical protein
MKSVDGMGERAAPVLSDPFSLVGTLLAGRFLIEALVAEGGFGLLYRGMQVGLDRHVAIKVLKVPTDPVQAEIFLSSFVQEAKTIAKLRHPAIVQVLDFGATKLPTGPEAPFIVLEWISGGTLTADLAARAGQGGRSPEETLRLFRPVLEAVEEAHREGIAHRDIKPMNIMVVEATHGSTLRLLDFGLAKLMEGDVDLPLSGVTRTSSSAVAFSPRYASPEQVSGARTGPWTDVHALGLLLVEVLVGQRPYKSSHRTDLFREVMSPVRPTPARFGVDVGAWEAVLLRALAPHPANRYAHAGLLLEALVEALPEATLRAVQGAPPEDAVAAEAPPAMEASGPSSMTAAVAVAVAVAPVARGRFAALATTSIAVIAGTAWFLHGAGAPSGPTVRDRDRPLLESGTGGPSAIVARPTPPDAGGLDTGVADTVDVGLIDVGVTDLTTVHARRSRVHRHHSRRAAGDEDAPVDRATRDAGLSQPRRQFIVE